MKYHKQILIFFILGLQIVLLSGCASNPATGDVDFMLVSAEGEDKLGKEQHPVVLYRYGEYDNAALSEYVSHVGNKIVKSSDLPQKEFHFFVLDTMDVNAFALPGGYIYITRGLLAMLNSEAELAAVLGHEIAHVTARHAARKISSSTLVRLGFDLSSAIYPELKSSLGYGLYNFAGGALIQGYGRDYELESDKYGATYIANAGYDPLAMYDVIRTLKNHEIFIKSTLPNYPEESFYHAIFKSHPDNDERLKETVETVSRLKREAKVRNRTAYLNQLKGLEIGYSKNQGAVSGRYFFHEKIAGGVKATFPKNWFIKNTNPAVIAYTDDKKERISLVINSYTGNPYAQALSFLNTDKIDGWNEVKEARYKTYSGIAPIKAGKNTYYVRVALVVYNKTSFIFVGKPRYQKGSNQFDAQFYQVYTSVAPMKHSERKYTQSRRLVIATGYNNDKLKNSIQAQDKKFAYGYLLLINDLYPNKNPAPGESYKIVK